MKVEIYSKKGCHLCDEAKSVVKNIQKKIHFDLIERDITSDPALEREFGEQIPVIFINNKKAFKFFVTEEELVKKIRARADGAESGFEV